MNPASRTGQPIRSLQTMLRTITRSNGQPCAVIPDGVYDTQTVKAVYRFQQEHNLPATGVTDEKTWDSIVRAFEEAQVNVQPAQGLQICMSCGESMKQGCTSHYVPLVQTMLALLCDSCGSIPAPGSSGILDEATAESLRSFQNICGLPCSGAVDKATWKHLTLQYQLAAKR